MKLNYAILIISILLSGCTSFSLIKSGVSEEGYFESAADKTLLIKEPGEHSYSFNMSEFYKTHRNSIISSDATTRMEINYVESGDENKPAVLFVHGTPGTWSDFWRYLIISDLTRKAHLVSVDRPGWGDSYCNTTDGKTCFYPLLKQQSKYLDTLIKKLDEQNNHQGVILVGWSLGGPLIGQIAHDYPEYVKGVIFAASPFDPELSHPRWYNWLSHIFSWVVPIELEKSNEEMMPLASQLKDMNEVWNSINVPIWVIQGTIDDLVDRKNLDYAKQIFAEKDATFIEVETSGHFVVTWEKMSILVKSIEQALEKL